MSVSATWQVMPEKWLRPVMEGVLSLVEVSELWDLLLMHPGQWVSPPPHLREAVSRLSLWQREADPTLH